MSLPQDSKSQYSSFLSLCMQGRGGEALVVAKKIPLHHLNKTQRVVIQGAIARFSKPGPIAKSTSDPIQALIRIYEIYWHQALLRPESKRLAERSLLRDLRLWLHISRSVRLKTSSLDAVEKRIKKEVETMGYYCLTGTVAPLRELEIWINQREHPYHVKLTESSEKVRVFLMSEYLTKGWMAYATMNRNFPGGWAKKEGLYCNTHAFRLKSERFLISFLRHEAQHFADYKRFPKLGSNDLEYRAKLAELSAAKKMVRTLIDSFLSRANSLSRDHPHAFANYCVLRDLSKKITGADDPHALGKNRTLLTPKRINKVARELLREHSRLLIAKGAHKTRGLHC